MSNLLSRMRDWAEVCLAPLITHALVEFAATDCRGRHVKIGHVAHPFTHPAHCVSPKSPFKPHS